MRTIYRVMPSVACLVVAAASFALSYVALRDVSAEVGAVPAHLAWLVPVVIDGGVIGASVVIWANSAEGRRVWFPFAVVAALVTMSVVVNTAHAGGSTLAKVIAALPPIVLLATLELVASQSRAHRDGSTGDTGTDRAAERDSATAREAADTAAARVDALDGTLVTLTATVDSLAARVEGLAAPGPRTRTATKKPATKKPAATKRAATKKAAAAKAPAAKAAPATRTSTTTAAPAPDAADAAPADPSGPVPSRLAVDDDTVEREIAELEANLDVDSHEPEVRNGRRVPRVSATAPSDRGSAAA